ncbi:unnamed protein product [Orchesella dallaii]|uniref:Uncharacterized protein n=1 Tax=Orchesella dallaii TaxID=48710 RepID=A0ABP1RMR8_9HEXA
MNYQKFDHVSMGTEALFETNEVQLMTGWPWTPLQATFRLGALYSSGIGAMWLKSAEWVLKAADEKAIQIMKGMFPDVRKLDITGNIAVIFYTYMIFHAVAFAIFTIEYLRVMIWGSIKNQITVSESDVTNNVPTSESSIESPVTLEELQANTDESMTEPASDRAICEIQPDQDTIMEIKRDVVDLDVSIVGGGDSHLDSIVEAHGHGAAAKYEQLQPDAHFISIQVGNFQNISNSSTLAGLPQTQENVVLVDGDKGFENDSISSNKSDTSQNQSDIMQKNELGPFEDQQDDKYSQ